MPAPSPQCSDLQEQAGAVKQQLESHVAELERRLAEQSQADTAEEVSSTFGSQPFIQSQDRAAGLLLVTLRLWGCVPNHHAPCCHRLI